MKRSYTEDQLRDAVSKNYSLRQTLLSLGLNCAGNSYTIAGNAIKSLGLDTSHWKPTSGTPHISERPIEDYLSNKYAIHSHPLKKKLIRLGILEWKCSVCGIVDWNGKRISLELDHINGNHQDNSLDNLRIICPNCHSQTDNNCGKNVKKSNPAVHSFGPSVLREKKKYYCKCGKEIKANSVNCRLCNPHINKIIWPTKEILEKLVWQKSMTQLAIEFGVTASAIKKHCQKVGISSWPGLGYWAKEYVKHEP